MTNKDRDATIDLLKSWGSRQGTKRAYEAVQLAIKHMKGNTLSAEHERLRPKKKKKKGSAEERLAMKMRAGSRRKKG
mgnify:CR=1 FL=1|jgi:hypothetical protein